MSTYPNPSDDSTELTDIRTEAMTHDIQVNRASAIERAVDDYAVSWQGILREFIQNGGDGWGENKLKGIIPEDQPLNLRAELDTENCVMRLWDNAGGMSKETLIENLFALDNTSESKADGKGAGSYGRGFWVIVGSGTVCYVETMHGNSHWAAEATTDGKHSDPFEPENPKLSESGTYIEVHGLNEHYMDGRLEDWETIEDLLIENYAFLLLRDDVNMTYVIDGEEHTPDVPDLNKLADEATLHFEDELETFTHHGTEYKINDLTIVDATEFDDDLPWTGVAMMKGNDYLDHPILNIEQYRPHHIPSLNGDDPQMFGWCDATELCPELENNSHEKFDFPKEKTEIKPRLKDVHEEHFKQGQSTSEKEEVFKKIQKRANDLLANQSEALNGKGVPEQSGTGTGSVDGDGDEKGKNRTTTPSPMSLLNCQVEPGRSNDVGDSIPLSIVVNVPAEPDCDAYDIYDVEVENTTTGEIVISDEMLTRDAVPDTPITEHYRLNNADEGRYVFRANIQKSAGVHDAEQAKKLKPREDKSHVYFSVGDVEPETEETDNTGEDDDGPVSFIEDIEKIAVTNLKDFPHPAYAEEGDNGGFTLTLNFNWPELEDAIDIPDEEKSKERQVELGVKYAKDAVIKYMLREDCAEMTEGVTTQDGEDLKENLINMLERRLNTQGLLEIEMHS